MANEDSGAGSGAGQKCPALKELSNAGEVAFGEMTPEEWRAIKRLVEAPAARRASWGRALALAWGSLKITATLALGASVAIGYADGNEFDDVGCAVAVQPGGNAHGGQTAQARRDDNGGKIPRKDGGAGASGPGGRPASAGASEDGASDGGGGRPVCEVCAENCGKRMVGGICRQTKKLCRLIDVPSGFEPNESEAQRVFLLMQRLEGGRKERKASLPAVFRLIVLRGHSQAKAARLCECSRALVSRRVKTIESGFGMPIERLRNFASRILEMEASVKGDRRRRGNGGVGVSEAGVSEDGGEELDEDGEG